MLRLRVLAVLFLFSSLGARAQLVSGNAFLQGNYLEVGMASCGVFGSSVAAPTGYHTQGSSYLGFVADVDKDGWNTGTPNYCGDYFRPGSPEEGFSVEINGTNYGNFEVCDEVDISGSFSSVNNSGATVSATWDGSVQGLDITQVTEFDTNTVYFSTTVTMTNTNTTTLEDIFYMRNVDPDNEQPLGGGWNTNNTVEYQNPNSQNIALVSATGLTHGCIVALGAMDPRAKVSHGGFHNRSASGVYYASGSLNGSGTSYNVDQAISISFNIGDLSPGESTCLTFFYMFDTTEYATALSSTSFECINLAVTSSPTNLCQGDSFMVGYYLDTANISPSSSNVFTVQLSDSTGSFASPVTIGTKTSTLPEDSIGCMIPSSIPFGYGYRVRVVMSSPSEIGADNGANITIGTPQPLFGATTISCSATPAVLTVQPGAEFYVWSNGSTSNSITASTSGVYSVTVLNGSCIDTFSTTVTANLSPLLFLTDTFYSCNTDSIQISGGLGYPQYNWSNGATTPTTHVTENGTYYLTVTNSNGCTAVDSTYASLVDARIQATDDTVCPLDPVYLNTPLYSECLYFLGFGTDNVDAQDISAYSGDDYGPIAVTPDYIYYTGDVSTVRMDVDDFSNKVQFLKRDGLFSDLATGQLYTFWNNNYSQFYYGQQSAIRLMNENLSYQGTILLDQSIQTNYSYGNAVFAGEGFVILYSNYTDDFYHINLTNGDVTELASSSSFGYQFQWAEGWASYGIAECNENGYAVVFNQGSQIRRFDLSTLQYTTITNFGSTQGDMPSITYSPWNGNWYFLNEGGSSLLGFGNELIGKAPASLGSQNFDYLWSTGDTTNTIFVHPLSTTTYGVTITDGVQTCTDSRTIVVEGTPATSSNDTILACNSTVDTIDAGGGYTSYAWSNGATTQSISVPPGFQKYAVNLTDSVGCSFDKTFTYIDASEPILVDSGPYCADDTLSIVPLHVTECNEIDLSVDHSHVVNVAGVFSNDAAGLVVTKDFVYYNTSTSTIRFNKELGSPVVLGKKRGLMVNTLTDELWVLHDTTAGSFSGGSANALLKLSSTLGPIDTVPLSEPLTFGNSSGIFTGSGYVIAYLGSPDVFKRIDLFTGEVETLSNNSLYLPYAEDFAIYGIASCSESGGYKVYYSPNTNGVYSYDIGTNTNTYEALAGNYQGFLESMAPDFHTGRWYFHYEQWSSLFGYETQALGYADMNYTPSGNLLAWGSGNAQAIQRASASQANDMVLHISTSTESCTDTVQVTLHSSVDLGLPDSINNCLDSTVNLTMASDPSIAAYYWSNGDSGLVTTVNATGSYTAFALDTIGCTHSDEVRVTLAKAQILPSSLANCDNEGVTLSIDAEGVCFEPVEMTADSIETIELISTIGDDRGGIAVTPNYVYYVGDYVTARLTHGLDSLTSFATTDHLFYDMASESLFRFNTYLSAGVTTFYQLDESLNPVDTLTLSPSLSSSNNTALIASGTGFVLVGTYVAYNTFDFYHVDLQTGSVVQVGDNISFSAHYAEGVTTSCIATCTSDGYEVIYKDGAYNNRISKVALPSGDISVVQQFPSSIGDIDGIAFSPWDGRWFGQFEYNSYFGSGSHTLFTAAAPSTIPKQVLWSTGETSPSIEVNPTTATTYSVSVSYDFMTCEDSVSINVATPATLALTDTVSGCETSLTVTADSGFLGYLWSNGDTTLSTTSGTTNQLILTVVDSNYCIISDTVVVRAVALQVEAADSGICAGDSITLRAGGNLSYNCLSEVGIAFSNASTSVFNVSFDDRSGIALSGDYVYVTGDYGTVKVHKDSLAQQTLLTLTDGLFSDLQSGQLYALHNTSTGSFSSYVNSIRLLDANLNTQSILPLSRQITLGSYYNTVFAGVGQVGLFSSYVDSVYVIDLSSGEVSAVASTNLDGYSYSSEGFASYGVMQCDGAGGHDFLFRSGNYIRRFNSTANLYYNVVYNATNWGEIACFTIDYEEQRWYFAYEYFSSIFGGGFENVGYADASANIELDGIVSWSTGDTALSITVSPTSTTQYGVQYAFGSTVCEDSMTISVSSPPTLSLDSLYTGCGESLTITLNAHNYYAWSTGDSTQSVSIGNPGIIWAGVADTAGCFGYDTALVAMMPGGINGSDSSLCTADSVLLAADLTHAQLSVLSFQSTGDDVNIQPYIWDDYCGIAVTPEYVFASGDLYTVRANAADLTDLTYVTQTQSIFAEYGDGNIYKFWNTSSGAFTTTVNSIIKLDEDLTHVDTILLSENIVVSFSSSYRNGVFPGAGYVLLYSGYEQETHKIDLETGDVSVLSTVNISSTIYASEGWASYGFSETTATGHTAVFRSGTSLMVRFNMVTSSTISSLSSMGDMANVAYSPWNSRWYMTWEGSHFLGYQSEGLGYAGLTQTSAADYIWSTGDTTLSIYVTPSTTQTYTLSVSIAGDTCTSDYTIAVPSASPSMGLADTVLSCGGNSMLSVPSWVTDVAWSNGEFGTSITPTFSGPYYVSGIDTFGCVIADTTMLILIQGGIVATEEVNCIGDSALYVLVDTNDGCGYVNSIESSNANSLYVYSYTGDDNVGFAVTDDYIYLTGDYGTVRTTPSLSSPVTMSNFNWRNSIFSDLSTGELYAFFTSGSSYLNTFTIDVIFHLNENMQSIDTIALSETISANSGAVIFSGFGYVIIFSENNDTFYKVLISTGHVTTLGVANTSFNYYNAEGWVSYGFADCDPSGDKVFYRQQSSHNISAYVIQTGSLTTAASMSNLGDAGMIGYSPWTQKWYGTSEFGTQFSNSGEHIWSADVTTENWVFNYITWNNGATGDSAVYAHDSTENIITATFDGLCSSCASCSFTDTVFADEPLSITTSTLSNNTCPEDTNGGVEVTISGSSPYSVMWSSGDTTDTVYNLETGMYHVTVSTPHGCASTDSALVDSPEGIQVLKQWEPPTCPGDSNGSINLIVSGAYDSTSYAFLWSTGSTTSGDSGLAAGTYSVTITDSIGCQYYRTYNLPDAFPVYSPAPITVSQNPVCSGQPVTVSAFSGIGGGSGISVYSQTSPVQSTYTDGDTIYFEFVGLSTVYSQTAVLTVFYRGDLDASNEYVTYYGEGGYYLGTSDATAGCATYYGSKSFTVTSSLLNNWNLDDTVRIMAITTEDVNQCSPKFQGYTRFNYIEGSRTYWFTDGCSMDTSLAFDSLSSFTFTPDSTTTFYARNYTSGCWSTCDSVTVNIQEGAQITTNIDTINLCDLSSVNVKAEGADVFYWQPTAGLSAAVGDSVIASPSTDRTYTIYGQNSNGCQDTAYVRINVNESLYIDSLYQLEPLCAGDSNGALSVVIKGGNSPYSYMWNTGDTVTSLTNLGSGNYWIYANDTVGQCHDTFDIVLDEPDSLMIDFDVVHVSCNGLSDGSITAIPTGGTPPFAFNWSTGDTTQLINGLAPNTYEITITDANGCSFSAGVAVVEPNVLNTVLSADSIDCVGDSSGAIMTNVTGGTAPYFYAWSTGGTTDSITNLSSGNYSVIVTDNNGCKDTADATLSEPDSIISTITIMSQVECFGDSSGAIQVTTTAPTPVFNWSTGDTTSSITGIPAGPYAVTITSADGCLDSASITLVNTPLGFSVSVDSTRNLTCFNAGDGYGKVSASGSGAPFSYAWSNGGYTSVIDTLSAGAYVVTISDSSGCADTVQLSVSEPPVLTLSIDSLDHNDCFGDSAGQIYTTTGGGTGGIAYTWSNGDTVGDLNGLLAGTYIVTVQDENGCSLSDSATVLDSYPMLSLTASITDVTCFGDSSGSIATTVTGGDGSYSYSWSHGATTDSVSQLATGTYVLTATDGVGCTLIDSFSLAFLTQPSVSIVQLAPVICEGDSNAQLTAAVGGTAPFTLTWNGTLNGDTLNDVHAGQHYAVLTDSFGCEATDSMEVLQPLAIAFSVDSLRHVYCFGDSTGYIEISASGGAGEYELMWSHGDTTATIDALPAGAYTVTLTDSLGCVRDTSLSVTEPSLLQLSLVDTLDPLCNGDTSGIVSTQVSGGSGAYQYYWNGMPGAAYDSSLNAGSYQIVVIDSLGCSDSVAVTLGQLDPVAILQDSLKDLTCYQSGDGVIAVHGEGGTGTFSYQWSTSQIDSLITGLDTGVYIVTVTDANNCFAVDTFTVSQPDSLYLLIDSVSNTSCYDSIASGAIHTSAFGGVLPYSYTWSTGADSSALVNVGDGVYTVTLTDANGCTFSLGDTVVRDTFPVASQSALAAVCVASDSIPLSGGLPLGGTYFGNHVYNDFLVTDSSGSGMFDVYYLFVDMNGCADTAHASITVDSVPNVQLDSIPTACLNIGTIALTQGTPAGGTYFGPGVSGNEFDPLVTDTGLFMIGYEVTTPGGCADTAYRSIRVDVYPTLSYVDSAEICGNALPVMLQTGTPAGGYHVGEGVSNGMFNPASVNASTAQLGYVYEHVCGIDTAFHHINLLDYPTLELGDDVEVCRNDSIILSSGESYATYDWNGTVFTEEWVFQGASAAGNEEAVTLTVGNEHGCTTSDQLTVSILDTQEVNLVDTSVCLSDELWIEGPDGENLSYYWSTGDVTREFLAYNATLVRPAMETVGLEVVNGQGCLSTDSVRIDIYDCDTIRPIGFHSIYPNPSMDKFTLEVYLQYAQEMNIFVYDVSGKLLDLRVMDLPEGKNWVDFTTEKFGQGIIILRFTIDDVVIAERVVIL